VRGWLEPPPHSTFSQYISNNFVQFVAMKKFVILLLAFTLLSSRVQAWWDAGHMVTAMIAYLQLNDKARARVDELTKTLARDYPQVNHFIVTGPWPDDLKADGVRAYDTWHYTDVPYNVDAVALPTLPEVDAIWAVNQSMGILRSPQTKELEKARFLSFLVHIVSDLHMPLHCTTRFSHEHPGGDQGGNLFGLKGTWRNLHAMWDDGCGYLSPYADIRPFGKPKEPLTEAQIERIRDLAKELMKEFPERKLPEGMLDQLDPDFWALESHKLAVAHAYRGPKGKDDQGKILFMRAGEEPTAAYLDQAQAVAKKQLVISGYRLGRMLNELFGGN
jgi:S1/P1 Nuclease